MAYTERLKHSTNHQEGSELQEQPQDAITQEEMEGTAAPAASARSTIDTCPTPKNAFAELMSPRKHKRKPSSSSPSVPLKRPSFQAASNQKQYQQDAASNAVLGRDALLEYILNPMRFPPSRVISHSDAFVTIRDLYPKSSVHLLLLPRDLTKSTQHPFDALADPDFLAAVTSEATKLRSLAAGELRRLYGRFSAQDSARNAAMAAEDIPTVLPPGRDWEKEIVVGVHAHPSMTHLHVHIISVDRVSECMRHRKHYNSFATPFLVPLDAFPLEKNDVRKHPGREGYLDRPLTCWRCGRVFGNKFKELKKHLDEELEVWKKL